MKCVCREGIYCIGYIEEVCYPRDGCLHTREAENPIVIKSLRLGASEVPIWHKGLWDPGETLVHAGRLRRLGFDVSKAQQQLPLGSPSTDELTRKGQKPLIKTAAVPSSLLLSEQLPAGSFPSGKPSW